MIFVCICMHSSCLVDDVPIIDIEREGKVVWIHVKYQVAKWLVYHVNKWMVWLEQVKENHRMLLEEWFNPLIHLMVRNKHSLPQYIKLTCDVVY